MEKYVGFHIFNNTKYNNIIDTNDELLSYAELECWYKSELKGICNVEHTSNNHIQFRTIIIFRIIFFNKQIFNVGTKAGEREYTWLKNIIKEWKMSLIISMIYDLMQINNVDSIEPVYTSADIFHGKIRRIEHLYQHEVQ